MNKVLYAIIVVVALASGLFIYKSTANKSAALPLPDYALYYQKSREIKPFSMTDHNGQLFNNKSLEGKWSWVFFGYTSCPDVCPTTLQELNFSYENLQKISPNHQVLLVTVDPFRDTQEKLSQYINYFHQDFIALRAGHEVLFPFARNLGLMYALTDAGDTKDKESYLVDHSASIVLVNPDGRIAAIFKPQHEIGQLPTIEGKKLIGDFVKVNDLSKKL